MEEKLCDKCRHNCDPENPNDISKKSKPSITTVKSNKNIQSPKDLEATLIGSNWFNFLWSLKCSRSISSRCDKCLSEDSTFGRILKKSSMIFVIFLPFLIFISYFVYFYFVPQNRTKKDNS